MKRFLAVLFIILSVCLAATAGVLGNAITLPSSIKDAAPALLGLCLLCTIVLAVMEYMRQQKEHPSSFSFELLQGLHPYTRRKMLEKVEHSWIRGYLTSSLFTNQALPLKASYQPTAVAAPNGFRALAPQPSASVSLHALHDLSHDGLLLLGNADAGKTITLLELTRLFLDQAQHDETQPIPAVFSLASWSIKQAPLRDWLVQELQVRYTVPPQRAQYWIDTDQLLPLLDDFDMVADSNRAACIRAINEYQQQHGLIPLVVCSRSTEYFAQPLRLHLQHAVTLEPLSSTLVARYLAQDEQNLRPVRTMLKRYPQIMAYIRFPRLLDLLAHVLTDRTPLAQTYRSLLRRGNFRQVKEKLLHLYVQKQMEQIPVSSGVTPQQLHQTLRWLALGMKVHHQTFFTLEELQPDWLPGKPLPQQAQSYVRMLIWSVFLIAGQLNGILLSQSGKIPFMTASLALSLFACGRFLRLVEKDASIVRKPDLDVSVIDIITWAWQQQRSRLLRFILRNGSRYLLLIGGVCALLGLLSGLWQGWSFGLVCGVLLSLFAVVSFLAGGGIGAVKVGLKRRPARQPKDGIWRSVRHGMLYGLLIGGEVGSTAFFMTQALQFGLHFSPWFALALGIMVGLNMWLFCSLINGGYTLLQYYVLCSLLKKAGLTPGKLPDLLNLAVRCRLLSLVNSSYMFPHRWLLDYFASYS